MHNPGELRTVGQEALQHTQETLFLLEASRAIGFGSTFAALLPLGQAQELGQAAPQRPRR
jgi:hypothetical protein